MKPYSLIRLYEAWIEAWSLRCCPPDKVLTGEMTPELGRHLEPWNRYFVRSADLFLRLGRVSPQCLESVRQAEQASIQEIEIGSLLWFFRHMEVETGFMMTR
ncbi:hypothetical protein ACLG6S_16380 [Thermodesulfobacteriota bacterium B35]